MLNFSSGNLPFGFLNQLQFKALIHESFQEVSLNYQCMTARGGFSAEIEPWLVYLGEHSCHNFYCAHIFCGQFCLFFLFSGRINEKIFKKNRERIRKRHYLMVLVKLLKDSGPLYLEVQTPFPSAQGTAQNI